MQLNDLNDYLAINVTIM